MDEAEYGAASAQAYLDADLLNFRRRAAAADPAGSSTDVCEDCGEVISTERKAAMEKMGMGCTRCVACKQQFERRVR